MSARRDGRRRKCASTGPALPAHRARLGRAVPMIEVTVFRDLLSMVIAVCRWARWANLARLIVTKRRRKALELFSDAGVRFDGDLRSATVAKQSRRVLATCFLIEVPAYRRRHRPRRTPLRDGEGGFACLAAVPLRAARCLSVAGIRAGARRKGLMMVHAICIRARGHRCIRRFRGTDNPFGRPVFIGPVWAGMPKFTQAGIRQ